MSRAELAEGIDTTILSRGGPECDSCLQLTDAGFCLGSKGFWCSLPQLISFLGALEEFMLSREKSQHRDCFFSPFQMSTPKTRRQNDVPLGFSSHILLVIFT